MRILRATVLLISAFLLGVLENKAAIVTVNFDSGSQTITNLNGITPLTGGTAADGDGAVLQLGYFSTGTGAQPFSGSWVPLTGEGGANSAFATTSIGDMNGNGAGDGTYASQLTFDTTVVGKNSMLPIAGTPLAIRIYNAQSIAASTHYVTISSNLATWQWATPNDPPLQPVLSISLDDPPMFRLENGTPEGADVGTPGPSSFATTQPVPEPSVLALQGMVAVLGFCGRSRGRRRR